MSDFTVIYLQFECPIER